MALFGKSKEATEHRYTADRLSAYLDGQLSSAELKRVKSHLATCQRCQWDLDTLRKTVRWTSQLPTVPLPRVFTVPVPARPELAARRSWGLPLLQGATALVALLFFLAVIGEAYFPRFFPTSAPVARELGQAKESEAFPTQVAAQEQPLAVEVTVEVEAVVASEPAAEQLAAQEAQPTATAVPAGLRAPAQEETEAPGVGGEVSEAVEAPAPSAYEATVADLTAAEALTATAAAKVLGMGGPPEEASVTPAPAEVVTAAPTPTLSPTASPTPEPSATPQEAQVADAERTEVLEPTAEGLAEPAPEVLAAAPALPSPTAVAEVQAAPRAPALAEEAPAQAISAPWWLGMAVTGLGVAFILLAVATVAVMARRFRRP